MRKITIRVPLVITVNTDEGVTLADIFDDLIVVLRAASCRFEVENWKVESKDIEVLDSHLLL
jgi:hypothetical protein